MNSVWGKSEKIVRDGRSGGPVAKHLRPLFSLLSCNNFQSSVSNVVICYLGTLECNQSRM